MKLKADRVELSVPGSIGGLSPFGCVALAVSPLDRITVRAVAGPSRVSGTGEFVRRPMAETHPTVLAVKHVMDHAGASQVGIQLHAEAGIPRGAGLGAFAAQVVTGLVAAREMLGAQELISREHLIQFAVEMGADRLRACASLCGGLAVADPSSIDMPSVGIAQQLPLTAFVPDFEADESRKVDLSPQVVRFPQAASAASALAALVSAIGSGELPDSARLLQLTDAALIADSLQVVAPASWALVGWLREMGLPALVSGAGPSVVVVGEVPQNVRDASVRSGWREVNLLVAGQGALVDTGKTL